MKKMVRKETTVAMTATMAKAEANGNKTNKGGGDEERKQTLLQST